MTLAADRQDLLEIPPFLRIGSPERQAAIEEGRRQREKRHPAPAVDLDDLLS